MIYYHLALRYTRIFPDDFELVPFSGTADKPVFSAANETTAYFIGAVGSGDAYGQQFIDFMFSDKAADFYQQHGLTKP